MSCWSSNVIVILTSHWKHHAAWWIRVCHCEVFTSSFSSVLMWRRMNLGNSWPHTYLFGCFFLPKSPPNYFILAHSFQLEVHEWMLQFWFMNEGICSNARVQISFKYLLHCTIQAVENSTGIDQLNIPRLAC